MSGTIRVMPIAWLGVEGLIARRSFDSPVGFQEWTIVGAGVRVSSVLGHPAIVGFAAADLLPSVSVSGRENADQGLAFEGGLRIEPDGVPVTIVARYRFERFDFPDAGSVSVEQFDRLILEVGIRFGG